MHESCVKIQFSMFLKVFYFSDPYQSYDENNKNLETALYPPSISNGLPYDF